MAADQSTTPRAEFDPCEVRYRLIRDHPGYRIGDDGSLLSCWDDDGRITDTWRSVPLPPYRNGYVGVSLRTGDTTRVRMVHHLVLEAFVGPRPEGMEACHFPDKTRWNNRADNLRWDTVQGNARDRVFHNALDRASRPPRLKKLVPIQPPASATPLPWPMDTATRIAVLRALTERWRLKSTTTKRIAATLGVSPNLVGSDLGTLRRAGLVGIKTDAKGRYVCALTDAGKKAVRAVIARRFSLQAAKESR